MAEEEEDRLNFYSKYNRANGKQDINSLYSLIDDPNALNDHQIHIVNVQMLREEKSRKGSLSPSANHRKSSKRIITKDWQDRRSQQETQQNLDQINYKLQQLKKLEREFHEQLNRKERENRKKKQLRDYQRRQSEKYKDKLINVVDAKPEPNPSRKSSIPLPSRTEELPHDVIINHQLDFDDYYRDVPEKPVNQGYESKNNISKELREKILMQRSRQQYVQSVYEEDRKTNSIVIERGNIKDQILDDAPVQKIETNNLYQVELTHSQSQNVLPQYRFDHNNQEQPGQTKPAFEKQIKKQDYFQQQYSPARQLQHIQQSVELDNQPNYETSNKQYIDKQQNYLSQLVKSEGLNIQALHQSNQNIQREEKDYQYREEDSSENGGVPVTKNKTGTQQGQEMRQEIQDKVEPILFRSQFSTLQNHSIPQPNTFLSQTVEKSKIQNIQDIQPKVVEIVKSPPKVQFEIPQYKIQNKKGSFKRLMAQNRSNLVPRMAISTILNEHINEALIDFKVSNIRNTASPPLQHSIISNDSPSPIRKKRVNFKQKIVEQQLDKSHSRQSRPSFDRQPGRQGKNKGLLMNFFAEN